MKKNNSSGYNSDVFFDGMVTFVSFFAKSFFEGIRNLKKKDIDFFLLQLVIVSILFLICQFDLTIKTALYFFPKLAGNSFFYQFASLHWWDNFLWTAFFYFLAGVWIFGFLSLAEKMKYQKAVNRIFKENKGHALKIVEVKKISLDKKTILIYCNTMGISGFSNKKEELSASFGWEVEKIKKGASPGLILIVLSKIKLKKKYKLGNLRENTETVESFVVGKSVTGTIYQRIATLPHLLIAGTTGGGKSQFFKQALFKLLETSPNLQMYLIDLKGGIEMRPFGKLSNVQVCSSITEAVKFLRLVQEEMKERFDLLKETNKKEIDPQKDGRPRIIIGIDEASILYADKSRSNEDYKLTLQARRITDEIAKMGRAAAINLILATQKVSMRTVDTSIQENITGKMCFRMNTLQGSLLVLGNKSACLLPDIPGRGIWSVGNKSIEVQTPFLSDMELEEELEILSYKLAKKKGECLLKTDDEKNDNEELKNLNKSVYKEKQN
ncbi:MAG: FtsK/SpoIIIE domain-containing protein [Halobacteriovoraceae bacterium]|nr:FtsK/SpoIIIE domain-containing protein [Halobacteriovoraceae bacterium]